MHILIIGGGIGGLALAQGLKKAEISAAVYERDRTRSDRLQGYRISIREYGSRALFECLPPELFDAFLGTCGEKGAGMRFLTAGLKELLFVPAPKNQSEVDGSHSVSRITLRQVLLSGLGDAVHFGKKFSYYKETTEGKIIAYFEDGTSAVGDILVGADGVHSRVRKQFLPYADPIDTGILGIAGKIPLNNELLSYLPEKLYDGPFGIISGKGAGMFIALQRFKKQAINTIRGIGGNDDAIKLHPGLLFDNTTDYLMWGFSARREKYQFQKDPQTLSPEDLREAVLKLAKEFHPILRRLIADADSTTISLLSIRTAPEIPHWHTGRITLLGDAIHCMTPAAGVGANTALKDANLLRKELIEVRQGNKSLIQALNDYEVEMLRYGFSAVKKSLRNAKMGVTEDPVRLFILKSALSGTNTLIKLKRKLKAA